MSGSNHFNSLIISVLIISCIAVGIAAAYADFIVIGLVTGLFAGAFLLNKPKWSIWLILLLGLVIVGLLALWIPGLKRLHWAVSLLGFLLLAVSIFHRFSYHKENRVSSPHINIALAFLLYSILITLVQLYSVSELTSAVKRYFQVWGLMFALSWYVLDQIEIKRLTKCILYVAVIQLPFAVHQLVVLVPMRQGYVSSMPELVPADIVVGTFEGDMLGGGANAEMATFLIIVFAFLLARWKEGLLTSSRLFWISLPVLLPLFLGETKIVLILLPIMFIGLYGGQLIKNPVQAFSALVIGFVMTLSAGYVYIEFFLGEPMHKVIDDTLLYNVYQRGYGGYLLNRTSVLTFWWERNASDPFHLLLGHGLGSAHSGASALIPGHIDSRYQKYGIALTAAAQLLWETGALGLMLYLSIIAFAWHHAGALLRKVESSEVYADLSAIRAILPFFIVYLFYRSALLETMSFQIVFALILGYLSILSRSVYPYKSSAIKGVVF